MPRWALLFCGKFLKYLIIPPSPLRSHVRSGTSLAGSSHFPVMILQTLACLHRPRDAFYNVDIDSTILHWPLHKPAMGKGCSLMYHRTFWLPLVFSLSVLSTVALSLDTYIVSVRMPEALQQADPVALESYYKSFLPSSSTPDAGNLADSRLVYSYEEVFSGFSAKLTPAEVKEMVNKPGFLRAFPDYNVPLLTTRTPEFLGLRLGQGVWRNGTNLGEGVIIGMVDSGVSPLHPSFKDHGMPPPPAKWKGACVLPKEMCNNKIIGARVFNGGSNADGPGSPLDDIGHGTHTASTAAGAFVTGAGVFGDEAGGTAAGIAPRAHLAIYKVCDFRLCSASDVLKGIDTAVSDGVDVISLSIGISTGPFYLDPLAIGSFGAVEKGVVVSCAAGNSGPYASTLVNDAPWILTVAAGTIDRSIRVTAKLPNGPEFHGQGLNQTKNFPKTAFPLVHPDCSTVTGGTAKGKVVLCDDIQSVYPEGLKSAGVVAMIARNNEDQGDTIITDGSLPLPSSFVSYADGQQLAQYVQASSKPVLSLSFDGTVLGASPAPEVASFSSTGPSTKIPSLIKPDVTAPGVNILAAWPRDPSFTDVSGSHDAPFFFNILSGTSMAAPHISGTAALVKKAHPDWSPAAIKSAIMTTSYVLDNTGKPIKNGQLQPASFYEMGAGHVDASAAADPGLVYDTSIDDYISLLCNLGYADDQISSISRGRSVSCAAVGMRVISQQDLNYPSISVPFHSHTDTVSVNRTVTNVGPAPATYTAQVDDMPGVSVIVKPSKLVFRKEKEVGTFTVTFSASGLKTPTSMNITQGNLSWVSGKRIVRTPLLVNFVSAAQL